MVPAQAQVGDIQLLIMTSVVCNKIWHELCLSLCTPDKSPCESTQFIYGISVVKLCGQVCKYYVSKSL